MKQFHGFPARMDFTSIPNVFFSSLLPQITDVAELKTTLHVMTMLYRKQGYPRFVTFSELLDNPSLMSSLKGSKEPADEALRLALKLAVERGTVINMAVDKDGASEDVYFLNTAANRQVVEKIHNGELELTGLKTTGKKYAPSEELPDIFTLYEDNIGILTPMVADELREAEKLYPKDWISDAVKEAVLYNKRNIKFILKILENWAAEGKSDGTHQRHPEETDPDKYIKGKYGHMVRR